MATDDTAPFSEWLHKHYFFTSSLVTIQKIDDGVAWHRTGQNAVTLLIEFDPQFHVSSKEQI